MALVIPYVKQTWTDGVSSASAARFGVIEDGIFDVSYAPAVRAYHNAAQSISSSATLTALALNSERYDQAGNTADTMHDPVTNNSRLTCRYAGIYKITGNIEWASTVSNASGSVLAIRLNGATMIGRELFVSCDRRVLSVSTDYALAVNDYVELCVSQQTGSAVNINSSGNYSPEFMMVRVG